MKKIIAWLLVLALTAAISIGATLAYLTDTDEDVNVMTVGKVKIDQLEYERVDDETAGEDAAVQEFHDNKPLYPGVYEDGFDFGTGDAKVDWTQIGKDDYSAGIWNPKNINNELDKMVFVKNKGNYDAYVRTVFAFEAGNYENLDEFKAKMHLNLNETDWSWEWIEEPVAIPNEKGGETSTKYFIAVATYNEKLAPDAITEISLSQIALDKSATNADVEAFGETYQILVKTQAIQASGFESTALALDEGFGEIDDKNIPWETDAPTKGGTVYNALRYLNSDVAGEDITTKVNTITFGLNKDHEDVIMQNKGTLVDVEQDVPVYAYYVNNGQGYDVYLLADDDIYLPKDSTGLMKDMTELTAVYTDNLNTSRAETLRQLFRKCAKLTTVDTTGWDTSKVTDLHQVFYQCAALQSIPGIEDWDTSLATTTRGMFRECGIKGDLDLSGWDLSNVVEMYQMFYKVPNLGNLNASGWKMSGCTSMEYMFYKANLKSLNASGWDTSGVTNMYAMFYECLNMESLNVTGWDTSNVTDTTLMFIRCRAMTEMIGSGGLNFGKVKSFNSMCEGWDSLTYIDVTNWNCGSGVTFDQMFAWALKLEKLEGLQNWDVSNATSLARMFYASVGLKEINVTGWDVSNVKALNGFICSQNQNKGDIKLEKAIGFNTWNPENVVTISSMFYGCGHLTELDLSGWNMPNLETSSHTFSDCYKLETIDFSGWNTPKLRTIDALFNDCQALKIVDMSDFNTENCIEFSQVFESCYSLEQIIGLENWDTSSACTFTQMFSGCGNLKELDLSAFNTGNARDNYTDMNNSKSDAFTTMFSGVNKLEKLIVGDQIKYLGNGNVSEANKWVFPNPAAKEGYTAMWRNVETGELFLGKDIPELTAATYEAYYEPISTT